MCVICAKHTKALANSGYLNLYITKNGRLKMLARHFRYFHCSNFSILGIFIVKVLWKKLAFFNFFQISTIVARNNFDRNTQEWHRSVIFYYLLVTFCVNWDNICFLPFTWKTFIHYTLSVNVNPIQDGGAKKVSYRFFPSNFYKRKTWHSKLSDF